MMMMNSGPFPPPLAGPTNDKINRELFVGNTPPGTSELLLLHFLSAAMRRVNLCEAHETPVLGVRVSSKFAFVEMATAELANKLLNLNGIPFIGGSYLKVSRPSKYVGPPLSAVSWQEFTGQDVSTKAPDPEAEKLQRELFIGNTTPEMTSAMLTDFLGSSMEQVGLTIAPGNPIAACRVSGKFAFIELRSAQEAAAALNMNGIPYLGAALRVGRPSKYNGPPDNHGNWEDIIAKVLSGEIQPAKVSRVVELKNMLSENDLNDPDEYQDILVDTREQCSEFGKLVNVVIPRAGERGATKIFLEYESTEDATTAIQALQGKTFDGRLVEAAFYDEAKFGRREFS